MNSIRHAIVFDTETTGLPKKGGAALSEQPKIIEFAGIRIDENLKEVDRFEFMCNPGQKLESVITKITGIKDSDLVNEKPFPVHYPSLCDFFLGVTAMVAHNLEFDRNLLSFELERIGRLKHFPWPSRHVCTVEESMGIRGRRMKNSELYKMATDGEEISGAHRAMNDVEASLVNLEFLINSHGLNLFGEAK